MLGQDNISDMADVGMSKYNFRINTAKYDVI